MIERERQYREEIRELLVQYNINGDRAQFEQLVETFSKDGMLHYNGVGVNGRAAILDRLKNGRRNNPTLNVMRHHLSTSLIEIKGNEATGRTYFYAMSNAGPDHHGVYVDKFRRIDRKWKISSRQVRIDWQSPQSLTEPQWVRGKPPGTSGA